MTTIIAAAGPSDLAEVSQPSVPPLSWILLGTLGALVILLIVFVLLSRRKKHRRRRAHRPRNPTRAETGGLPPVREDLNQPPI